MQGMELRQGLPMIPCMVLTATPNAPVAWLRIAPLALAVALPLVAQAQPTAAVAPPSSTSPAEALPWGSGWERRQSASAAEGPSPGTHRNPAMQPGGAGFARGRGRGRGRSHR